MCWSDNCNDYCNDPDTLFFLHVSPVGPCWVQHWRVSSCSLCEWTDTSKAPRKMLRRMPRCLREQTKKAAAALHSECLILVFCVNVCEIFFYVCLCYRFKGVLFVSRNPVLLWWTLAGGWMHQLHVCVWRRPLSEWTLSSSHLCSSEYSCTQPEYIYSIQFCHKCCR